MLLLAGILAAAGCGGGAGDGATTPAATPVEADPAAGTEPAAGGETAAPAGPSLADQLAAGQVVWDQSCISCHKYGSKGGELIGQYPRSGVKNAAELAAFIKEKMPKDDPGTLSDDQAWAVTAHLLSKRGKLGDAPLTRENAASLSLE
jgi:mono/diheme cytochrome c family protein